MFKKPKVWFRISTMILFLAFMVACTPDNEDLTGSYQYEKTIYGNPLSSFIMTRENADKYSITRDYITILHPDGTKEQVSSNFQKSDVDIAAFSSLFMLEVGVPDISNFKQRHQYSVNEKYRLYVMDNEIWLAQCPRDTMWSIYQLVKVKDN